MGMCLVEQVVRAVAAHLLLYGTVGYGLAGQASPVLQTHITLVMFLVNSSYVLNTDFLVVYIDGVMSPV